MKTLPEFFMAGFLALSVAAFGIYLARNIPPYIPRPPVATPPPTVSCQLGQLLVDRNCYTVSSGNVDMNLNQGNKFSTPREFATFYIVSGSVRVDYLYNRDEHRFFRAGETFGVSPDNIIAVLENNTKLQKRVR